MEYVLKQYDTPLLKFSATTDTSDPEIEILWRDDSKKNLLPLDLGETPESLRRWLLRRTIPKNRAFVHSLLAKCGLNINRPMSIIDVCKGLSLNDCYWVVHEDDTATFAKANLYEILSAMFWRLWRLPDMEADPVLPCDPARNSPPTGCFGSAGAGSRARCTFTRGGRMGRPTPA